MPRIMLTDVQAALVGLAGQSRERRVTAAQREIELAEAQLTGAVTMVVKEHKLELPKKAQNAKISLGEDGQPPFISWDDEPRGDSAGSAGAIDASGEGKSLTPADLKVLPKADAEPAPVAATPAPEPVKV